MAGHSKWANIRHRKGRQDAKRSKMWSKCSRAIIVAAKNGGGDPDMNLALRYAIDEAKAANMPKDTIQKAIEKGTGDGEGNNYEEIRYEGYGPAGVAVMLDLLTDNRNRTASEIRHLFDKYNGNLGATGCVSYMFEPKGELYLEKSKASEEQLFELALEAGAEDVRDEDEAWYILTGPSEYHAVRDALVAAGLEPDSAELSMVPDNTVSVDPGDTEKVMNFVEAIEDHDDVQKLHANYQLADAD